MKRFTVEYAPEALDQLAAIESYIAEAGSPEAGERFVDEIVSHCDARLPPSRRDRLYG